MLAPDRAPLSTAPSPVPTEPPPPPPSASGGWRDRLAVTAHTPSLLPIRLFLGLGWARAAVEKLGEPGWWDGQAIRAYLGQQLSIGAVTITPYGEVMRYLWRPFATPLGIGVMLAQLLIGVALLAGYRTRLALAVGMVLNVQFILAGSVDPSVFYLVLALALWSGHPEQLPGLDRVRGPEGLRPSRLSWTRSCAIAVAIVVAVSAILVPYVTTIEPAYVVEDPALILMTFTGLAALTFALRRLSTAEWWSARSRARPAHARTR